MLVCGRERGENVCMFISISQTIYGQLLHEFLFAKKYQSQIVSAEKLLVNVGELDARTKYQLHFMSSFYANFPSEKEKETL